MTVSPVVFVLVIFGANFAFSFLLSLLCSGDLWESAYVSWVLSVAGTVWMVAMVVIEGLRVKYP